MSTGNTVLDEARVRTQATQIRALVSKATGEGRANSAVNEDRGSLHDWGWSWSLLSH